jgi:2'-5' RNA ligase
MRLFLAIDLTQEARDSLNEQIEVLYREYRQFHWTPKENYHITLHFFGEVDNYKELVPKIEEALFEVRPFHLFPFEFDLFIQKKITLYLGFHREKRIEQIVKNVRDVFAPDEKTKYVPHLTIARYKIPSKQQYLLLKKKLLNLPIDLMLEVKKVTLFESINAGKFPIYKKLHSFKLEK